MKLNTRLDEGDKKDELAQLAITLNNMLSDLSRTFYTDNSKVGRSIGYKTEGFSVRYIKDK